MRYMFLALLVTSASHGADEPLVRAADLPQQADRLRKAGVPAAEVTEALGAAKGKGLSASEMADVLDDGADDAEKNGPIDNFGGFVKDKLDEGLRGRDLARAIHEEHARTGKGGGPKEGKGPPDDKGKGPPDDKGDKGGKGKSGDAPKGGKGKGGH